MARNKRMTSAVEHDPPPTSEKPPIDACAIIRAIELGMPSLPYPSGTDILDALDSNGWHAGRAARALGIGRATLWRRLQRWGISLRQEKKKRWSSFSLSELLKR